MVCEACADHCHTEGGPDACWEAHEKWRLTGMDDSVGVASAKPAGVLPAPRPMWPIRTLGPRALAVLRFFAAKYSAAHVRESLHPWNFDAWHCPERDGVKELVALGLAKRPFESPWIVNLTDEGLRALAKVRRDLTA